MKKGKRQQVNGERKFMATTSEKSHIVRLQLTCVTPPQRSCDTTEAEFGLQDRHQVVHPGQPQANGTLLYEFDVLVISERETNAVRFRDPYLHGTPAAPFLYLSWKCLSAGQAPWIKRLKVPLPNFVWDQFGAKHGTPCFAASISGTGSGTSH